MRMEIIPGSCCCPEHYLGKSVEGQKHSPKWWQYTETANGTYKYDCTINGYVFYKKGNWILEVGKDSHPLCKDYFTYRPVSLTANTDSNNKPLVFINDKSESPAEAHTYSPLQSRW